jgi:hypothetical protein
MLLRFLAPKRRANVLQQKSDNAAFVKHTNGQVLPLCSEKAVSVGAASLKSDR